MMRMKLYHFITFLASLVIFGHYMAAHPLCLDLSPPFKSDSNTGFCSQYSTFGCCTSENETVLEKRHKDIIRHLEPKELFWGEEGCRNTVEDILCLRCSPFAAHIFHVESTMEQMTFPGLCRSFCAHFVRLCPELLQHIGNNKSVPSTFCEMFQVSDKDYCFPDILTNDMVNNQIAIQSVDEPGCICVEEIAEGLKTPVFATNANDRTDRIFVGEIQGVVRIFYPDGSKIFEPFLDIRTKVLNTENEGDERGLLGLAFHPRFEENSKFYLYYSVKLPVGDQRSANHIARISEFKVSSYKPNMADMDSENIILEIDEPFANHNGGEVTHLTS